MPREDKNRADANAPKISSQPDGSLGDCVTGGDFAKAAKNRDRSLGDQSTSGDATSSVSDLSGAFDGADEGMELVDLSSRYDVRGTLGRGGMGDVVLAFDNRLQRQVAIKRVHGEMATNRRALERFLTEAQSIAALNHPSIVHINDFGRDTEGPFLILEYVDGGTLLQKLEAGPLPVAEAVRLSCQILDGLSVAHERGIIHRDIKPANILLTSRGDAKLTDFGLARQEQADTGLTSTGAILGTFDYMPPEQRKDAALTDSRSDLWSLAATLYQMLTGEPPRVIDLDALPPQLRPIVSIALKPKKEDRYQTAVEFHEALLASERQQAADADELQEGECANCHTSNSSDRHFCKKCGSVLSEPCLSCGTPLPVWEQFCGSCGQSAADSVKALRGNLKEHAQEVQALTQNYQYHEAIPLLEKMAAIEDHRLKDITQWAQSVLAKTREDFARKRAENARLFTAAKEAAEQCQYKEAAKFLSQIPEQLLDDQSRQLQASVQTQSERLKVLSEQIKTAVKTKQFDGLITKVEAYLTLKPSDDNANRLLQRLQDRSRKDAPKVDIDKSSQYSTRTANQSGSLIFWIAGGACSVLVIAIILSNSKLWTINPGPVSRTDSISINTPEVTEAKVLLNVEPSDASVRIVGENVAVTGVGSERIAIFSTPSGEYRLIVSCSGYKSFESNLHPESGKTQGMTVTLTALDPAKGVLTTNTANEVNSVTPEQQPVFQPPKPQITNPVDEVINVGSGRVRMSTKILQDGEIKFTFRGTGFESNPAAYNEWLVSSGMERLKAQIRKIGRANGEWGMATERTVDGATVIDVVTATRQ